MELTEFQSISFCNTFGLHLLKSGDHTNILVLDINGITHWKNQNLIVNLKEHLEEEKNYADFDLELVASDSFFISESSTTNNPIIYLATCWIVYDHLFAPERHFAALFTISTDETKLVAKFNLNSIPTYTRLIQNSPIDEIDGNKNLYWLVFAYSGGNCAFCIETEKTTPIERVGDHFPFLDIQDFPGSVIRSNCISVGNYRASIVGYDSGYVIASVCLAHSGDIIDRKSLKFDGPISILKVIQTDEGNKISILISSTIGPATVWELRLQDEAIHWEHTHILLESDLYDCIIAGAIHKNLIFIGTYGELLLIYDTRELQFRSEISPIHTVNVASPILCITPIDAEEIFVLSKKGLHKFKTIFSMNDDNFELNFQPKTSEPHSISPSNNSVQNQ